MNEITVILSAMAKGEGEASDKLMPLVYDELRRLATSKLARESPGQTLQATALVHEAWLRVAKDGQGSWENRRHFFGAAAEAMRRILIDIARRKKAPIHGGDKIRVEFEQADIAVETPDDQLEAVHEALDELAKHDPDKAELVKMRCFVGLTLAEAAEVIGVSEPTAKRYWAYARAWLYRQISKS